MLTLYPTFLWVTNQQFHSIIYLPTLLYFVSASCHKHLYMMQPFCSRKKSLPKSRLTFLFTFNFSISKFLKELFYTMSSLPIHTPTFSAICILSLTSKETALKRLTNLFEPYCFQVQRKFLLLFLFFTEVVDFVDRNLILPFLSFQVTNSTAFPLTLLANLPSLTFGLILSPSLNI